MWKKPGRAGGWGRECKRVRSKNRDQFYVFMYSFIFAAPSGRNGRSICFAKKKWG